MPPSPGSSILAPQHIQAEERMSLYSASGTFVLQKKVIFLGKATYDFRKLLKRHLCLDLLLMSYFEFERVNLLRARTWLAW